MSILRRLLRIPEPSFGDEGGSRARAAQPLAGPGSAKNRPAAEGQVERLPNMGKGLETISAVMLPRTKADETQRHLRKVGQALNEGMVLWSGIKDGPNFRVKSVIVPDQRPVRTEHGICVVIDGPVLHRLNVWLHSNGERLIAQVHSHPTEAFHSSMDDEYAIVTAAGSLSIVVPDFAIRPFAVDDCAVFRLSAQGRWTEIPRRSARKLISVMEEG